MWRRVIKIDARFFGKPYEEFVQDGDAIGLRRPIVLNLPGRGRVNRFRGRPCTDKNAGPDAPGEGPYKVGHQQSRERREYISVRVNDLFQTSVGKVAQQITGLCFEGKPQPLSKS